MRLLALLAGLQLAQGALPITYILAQDSTSTTDYAFNPLETFPSCNPAVSNRPGTCPPLVTQLGAATTNNCDSYVVGAALPRMNTGNKCADPDCTACEVTSPTRPMNAGTMIYAYNFPKIAISNSYYEAQNAITIFMVVDPDNKAFLVMIVDSGGWGHADDRRYVDIKMTSIGLSAETDVLFSDDPAGAIGTSVAELLWNPTDRSAMGKWFYSGPRADGGIIGPFPFCGFILTFNVERNDFGVAAGATHPNPVSTGLTDIKVVSINSQTLTETEVNRPFPAVGENFYIYSFAKESFCNNFNAAGQAACNANNVDPHYCQWCSNTNQCNFNGCGQTIDPAIQVCLSASPPPPTPSPPPLPPPPSPSPPVVIATDPHIMFAHGGRADLRGEDHTWYNLLSARNTSLNVLFTHADFTLIKPKKQLVHGSRMEQLVMVVRTTGGRTLAVEFNSSTSNQQRAVVRAIGADGKPGKELAWLVGATDYTEGKGAKADKSISYHRAKDFDNLRVSLRAKQVRQNKGMQLNISTHQWTVLATSVPFPNPAAHPGKSMLNVKVDARYDADSDVVAPHGIIGQSYDGDASPVYGAVDDYHLEAKDEKASAEVWTKAMAEGAIEGAIADYAMPCKYATAYKFSRFNSTAAKPRDATKLAGYKRPTAKHATPLEDSAAAAGNAY